ncbi:putative holin-like toxin [Enterococcus villorum]|nr:putative holin-like toxin [Enterococcus villorum]
MSVVEVIGWMIQFGEFVIALMMRISKKSTDITFVGLT